MKKYPPNLLCAFPPDKYDALLCTFNIIANSLKQSIAFGWVAQQLSRCAISLTVASILCACVTTIVPIANNIVGSTCQ
eukprot:7916552-Ditylum_brightwellii.AAC.1